MTGAAMPTRSDRSRLRPARWHTYAKRSSQQIGTLKMDGYRELREGQRCEFDIEQGQKGQQAANVRLL
jgi:'Cold-shock' DNA-binding domain